MVPKVQGDRKAPDSERPEILPFGKISVRNWVITPAGREIPLLTFRVLI